MKKLFILIALFAVVATAQAQDKVIRGASYLTLMGTAADTLVISDTLDYVIRLQGDFKHSVEIQQNLTKVSGTVTNNLFISTSMDGITYADVDTVANSNESTGITRKVLTSAVLAPYVRLRWISGATAQKASYQILWINRFD